MIRFLFLFIFAGRRRRHSSKERLFFPPLPLPAQSAKLLLMVCKQHDPTSTVVMVARGALGCQSVLRAQAERESKSSLSLFCSSSSHRMFSLLLPSFGGGVAYFWRGLFLSSLFPCEAAQPERKSCGKDVGVIKEFLLFGGVLYKRYYYVIF